MKLSLKYIIFIGGIVMFILTVFTPYVIERPKDLGKIGTREYSIKTSGLSPKGYWVIKKSITIVIICIGIAFFCSFKLDKSLTCEKDVVRLRRYWSIYNYLLLVGVLLVLVEITFTFFGLFTIQHICLAHIVHSKLFPSLTSLFFFISFFLFTNKYIKAVQKVPPSVILAAKRKD